MQARSRPASLCCRHLAYQLSVNLLAYDYSGYGESTGEPSPSGCYSDIQACWDYLTQERGFKPEEIVLYGQSVGSGPTGHLAARQPKLKGCVFHSGIVSGKFACLLAHCTCLLRKLNRAQAQGLRQVSLQYSC